MINHDQTILREVGQPSLSVTVVCRLHVRLCIRARFVRITLALERRFPWVSVPTYGDG